MGAYRSIDLPRSKDVEGMRMYLGPLVIRGKNIDKAWCYDYCWAFLYGQMRFCYTTSFRHRLFTALLLGTIALWLRDPSYLRHRFIVGQPRGGLRAGKLMLNNRGDYTDSWLDIFPHAILKCVYVSIFWERFWISRCFLCFCTVYADHLVRWNQSTSLNKNTPIASIDWYLRKLKCGMSNTTEVYPRHKFGDNGCGVMWSLHGTFAKD